MRGANIRGDRLVSAGGLRRMTPWRLDWRDLADQKEGRTSVASCGLIVRGIPDIASLIRVTPAVHVLHPFDSMEEAQSNL
jgi:hypothetical protein